MNGQANPRASEDNPVPAIMSALERAISSVFVGSMETVTLASLGLVGGLHVLIEDIPGVGKTTLAASLSRAADMSFSRIQFTPDMLPGDVLGMNVWDPVSREFTFRAGPVNASFILADELNRTSPRTQSAFLEAMQDGQVTVDGTTRTLPRPFFLIATQNPESFAGTFPLPEAELDRFGLSFAIGYPSEGDEREILRRKTTAGTGINDGDGIKPVTDSAAILAARDFVSRVHVSDPARDYIVSLVRATRESANIRLGASPRAAIFLQQAARTKAAASGRDFVIPEDAEQMAGNVLAHRILLSSQARLARMDARSCVKDVCASVPKPTGLQGS
jgi:MoxR-like ATPase